MQSCTHVSTVLTCITSVFLCCSWRCAAGVLLWTLWEIQRHGYGAPGPEPGGSLWPLWPDLFTEDSPNDSHSTGECRAQTLSQQEGYWTNSESTSPSRPIKSWWYLDLHVVWVLPTQPLNLWYRNLQLKLVLWKTSFITSYLAVQFRNLKRSVSFCSFSGFFYWPTNPIKSKHTAVISILVLYKTLGTLLMNSFNKHTLM